MFQVGIFQNPHSREGNNHRGFPPARDIPHTHLILVLRVSRSFAYVVSRATNYEFISLKFTASGDRLDCRFDKFAISRSVYIKASCDSPRDALRMRISSRSSPRGASGASPRYSPGCLEMYNVVVTASATLRCYRGVINVGWCTRRVCLYSSRGY